MKRELTQIAVYTTGDGYIEIAHDDPFGEPSSVIRMPPEQVPIICQWLTDAAAQIVREEGES